MKDADLKKSGHCNFFPINFKTMFMKTKLSVYVKRRRI